MPSIFPSLGAAAVSHSKEKRLMPSLQAAWDASDSSSTLFPIRPGAPTGIFFPFPGIAVNPALEKNWAFLPRPANTSSVSRLARQAANLISYTQSKLTTWFSAGALGRSGLCAHPRDKCFLSASGICMGSQRAETSGRCRALLPVSLAPAAAGTGVGFGIASQDGSQDIPALAWVLTWLHLPKRERNPNFLW